MEFVATASRGTEEALAAELRGLGAEAPRVERGAVRFEGSLELGYRALLWSRLASRLLLPVAHFAAPDEDALYDAVRLLPWEELLAPRATIAVRCVAARERDIHSRFWALRTKDALVDRMRARTGSRPDVDPRSPDMPLHLHVGKVEATLSLELSGGPMHRRGYRGQGAMAPLKENLAAALLTLAGWPAKAAEGVPLLDPMCGSGTLLLEGACMAAQIAPGLDRPSGLLGWAEHDAALWEALRAEAGARSRASRAGLPPIVGFDASAQALALARASARRLDLPIRLEERSLEDAAPGELQPGLLITNPPYGERLGEAAEVLLLYEQLGDVLRRRFGGWSAHVFAATEAPHRRIGLRPSGRHLLYNGPIECRLLDYPIRMEPPTSSSPAWRRPSPEAKAFDNRLKKNLRKLEPWAARAGLEAYRLYDAEIPEYNVAIDRYGDAIFVQEFERPRKVPAKRAEQRLRDVLGVLMERLGVEQGSIFLRQRSRQRDGAQYERRRELGELRPLREGEHRFLVNLTDYLDTGLFLDHRLLRARIARALADAPGTPRFLNLFAYTCTATVYAAAAGATTTSVDLSRTYLEWGQRNLDLADQGGPDHRLVHADCFSWLRAERGRYEVILLAPPSYSRSKRMRRDLDLQRDHGELLRAAYGLLAPGGQLYFSTHARAFELDPGLSDSIPIEEISARTVPPDFRRNPHRTWCLRAEK